MSRITSTSLPSHDQGQSASASSQNTPSANHHNQNSYHCKIDLQYFTDESKEYLKQNNEQITNFTLFASDIDCNTIDGHVDRYLKTLEALTLILKNNPKEIEIDDENLIIHLFKSGLKTLENCEEDMKEAEESFKNALVKNKSLESLVFCGSDHFIKVERFRETLINALSQKTLKKLTLKNIQQDKENRQDGARISVKAFLSRFNNMLEKIKLETLVLEEIDLTQIKLMDIVHTVKYHMSAKTLIIKITTLGQEDIKRAIGTLTTNEDNSPQILSDEINNIYRNQGSFSNPKSSEKLHIFTYDEELTKSMSQTNPQQPMPQQQFMLQQPTLQQQFMQQQFMSQQQPIPQPTPQQFIPQPTPQQFMLQQPTPQQQFMPQQPAPQDFSHDHWLEPYHKKEKSLLDLNKALEEEGTDLISQNEKWQEDIVDGVKKYINYANSTPDMVKKICYPDNVITKNELTKELEAFLKEKGINRVIIEKESQNISTETEKNSAAQETNGKATTKIAETQKSKKSISGTIKNATESRRSARITAQEANQGTNKETAQEVNGKATKKAELSKMQIEAIQSLISSKCNQIANKYNEFVSILNDIHSTDVVNIDDIQILSSEASEKLTNQYTESKKEPINRCLHSIMKLQKDINEVTQDLNDSIPLTLHLKETAQINKINSPQRENAEEISDFPNKTTISQIRSSINAIKDTISKETDCLFSDWKIEYQDNISSAKELSRKRKSNSTTPNPEPKKAQSTSTKRARKSHNMLNV